MRALVAQMSIEYYGVLSDCPTFPVQPGAITMPTDSTSSPLQTALVDFVSHSPLLRLHVESRYATLAAV